MKGCNHLVQERNSFCTGCNSLWEAFINNQEEKEQVDNSTEPKTEIEIYFQNQLNSHQLILESHVERLDKLTSELSLADAKIEALNNRINELEKWQIENETTQLEKMERKS